MHNMAQLDGMHMHRYGESPKTPASATQRSYGDTPKTPSSSRYVNNNTPKSPTTLATVEQLLRASGGEGYSRWPSVNSPTTPSCTSPTIRRDHYDPEEDHTPHHHHRKSSSVLAKVKEKAKKWRHTLSKKKHADEYYSNTTPSWGVSLDEEEEEEEDPEYLGAPMYESELAPEGYKETARQHPRAVHVISEKHVLVSSTVEQQHPQHPPPTLPLPPPTNKTAAETVTDHEKQKTISEPNANQATTYGTIANAAHEKLAPAYATVANAATETLAPAYASMANATNAITSKIQGLTVSAPAPSDEPTGAGDQKWDKGVSVKEYLMHKLEPGEDERALSQIISEAISPRRTTGNVGVVEKMKEAVSSLLLRSDDQESFSEAASSAPNSSPHIPISTNAHAVVEEENHGRILQAN